MGISSTVLHDAQRPAEKPIMPWKLVCQRAHSLRLQNAILCLGRQQAWHGAVSVHFWGSTSTPHDPPAGELTANQTLNRGGHFRSTCLTALASFCRQATHQPPCEQPCVQEFNS